MSTSARPKVAAFWRSLIQSADGGRCYPLAISTGSVPNAGESMEQRRARIQAEVNAIFAPPHPEEFRFRF